MDISPTFKEAQKKRAKRRLLDVAMVVRDRVSRRELQVRNSWFKPPQQVQILNTRAFARGLVAAKA
jgi:hypothetical protein